MFDAGMAFSSLVATHPILENIQYAVMETLVAQLTSLDVSTSTEQARVAALVESRCRTWLKTQPPEFCSAAAVADNTLGFLAQEFVRQFSFLLNLNLIVFDVSSR